ncbi:hypothetical protein QN277_013524 [Acacia crassicarpa]|uniref:Phytocyanin domain-containing protein n=1 Tax=Acacia crassicarpa TaxID=499986 RepID=A0AAE1TFV4_9FABA|nr:hypothetical protein QN277_013524 [Acacia crassicarpa]
MASLSGAAVSLLAIFMVLQLSSVAMATDYMVGDDRGWTGNYSYADWASKINFVVGDNLVFKYDNTKHDVYIVNGTMFQNCTVPDKNQVLPRSGYNVIPLNSPGKSWYICGVPNHCEKLGMKLAVNALPNAAPPEQKSAASSLLYSASLPFFVAMLAAATISV